MAANTLTKLIVAILAKAKKPLTNSQIRERVELERFGTYATTIDSTLNYLSKNGRITKTPVAAGLGGHAKNLYSVPKAVKAKVEKKEKQPSVASVVVESLKPNSKMDSMQVYLVVQSVLPNVFKSNVDTALSYLSKKARIKKSKNPMTDSNVVSDQSRFMYSL